MASVTSLLLPILSLVLLSFSIYSVSARPGLPFHPCNTLVVSTFSFSVLPENPDRNSNLDLFSRHRPHFLIVSTDLHPYRHHFRHRRFLPLMVDPSVDNTEVIETRPEFPSLGFSSLRDRTKDILSVVASLLFGAACGALTAGTMYLIWSLFNHRHGSYRSLDGFTSDDDDDNDDDDIFNPKKKGYVTIPAAPAKAVDSAPAPVVPAPTKESA